MIGQSKIEALLGLVGFRQSTITADAILDAGNIASSSGLFVGDISALITTGNIKSCYENKDISDTDFNTFLENRQKSSLINFCKSIFSENDLIENNILFKYESDFINKIDNDTSFVGYEIDPTKRKDISVIINKIMLEFTTSETVKVLLFHSSVNALKSSKEITTIANSTKHETVDFNLSLFNSVAGGKWYIGYLRSGLTGQAFNRQFNLANIQTKFNMFGIKAIQVDGWDAETLFDVNDIDYSDKTFGMNFDISSFKDYSSLIVENKNRFAKGLQLQIAADLLGLISTTVRSNQEERLIQAQALYELNGERTGEGIPVSIGVLKQLKIEIKQIKKMFNPVKLELNTLR